jgi:hypothetical protein
MQFNYVLHRQAVLTDLKLGDNVHWYNPGQAIYYAFTKGIVDVDPETEFDIILIQFQ